MMKRQVFDNGAGFEHHPVPIQQQRKLLDRPQFGKFRAGAGVFRREYARRKCSAVLVQRGEHLLRV